jgi:hypothetical protein
VNPMLTSLPLAAGRRPANDDRPMFAGASIYVNGFDPLPSRTRPVAVTAPETDALAAAFLSTWEPFPPGMVSAMAFRRAVAEGDRRSAQSSGIGPRPRER